MIPLVQIGSSLPLGSEEPRLTFRIIIIGKKIQNYSLLKLADYKVVLEVYAQNVFSVS